ncbi:MAG: hypothetical protein M3Y56_04850 [Armatimonadota bacterium]|nr:hypothetical protein [Armatimonadota bacterium]
MIEEAVSINKQALEGRVAQILNANELVINIGSDAGVQTGMHFRVLSQEPIEIVDPTTKAVLDTIDREKVQVEAKEVRPKITICKTYRILSVRAGSLRRSLAGDYLSMLTKDVVETLQADESSYPPPLPPERSYIGINDRVVEVRD